MVPPPTRALKAGSPSRTRPAGSGPATIAGSWATQAPRRRRQVAVPAGLAEQRVGGHGGGWCRWRPGRTGRGWRPPGPASSRRRPARRRRARRVGREQAVIAARLGRACPPAPGARPGGRRRGALRPAARPPAPTAPSDGTIAATFTAATSSLPATAPRCRARRPATPGPRRSKDPGSGVRSSWGTRGAGQHCAGGVGGDRLTAVVPCRAHGDVPRLPCPLPNSHCPPRGVGRHDGRHSGRLGASAGRRSPRRPRPARAAGAHRAHRGRLAARSPGSANWPATPSPTSPTRTRSPPPSPAWRPSWDRRRPRGQRRDRGLRPSPTSRPRRPATSCGSTCSAPCTPCGRSWAA